MNLFSEEQSVIRLKTTGIVTYYPKYQFSIDDETYILWIGEGEGGDGFILNTKDTFTLYTLSESSLSEIKELTRVIE